MILGILKFLLKLGLTGGFIAFLVLFSIKYKTHIMLQGEYILFQSDYGLVVLMIVFLFGFLFGIFYEKIKSFFFN